MISNVLILLGVVPYLFYVLLVGYPNLYKVLGGAFGFLILYPFAVYVHMRYREYRKLIWNLLYNILGILIFNHLFIYIRDNKFTTYLVAFVFVVSIPLSFIFSSIKGAVDGFVKQELRQDNEVYFNFVKFYAVVLAVSFISIIPIIDYTISINPKAGVLVSLANMVVAEIILLIETSRISLEQREFFSEPVKRINVGTKKAVGYLTVFIILFLFQSTYFEIYRGEWQLWFVSALGFVIHIILQFLSVRYIFVQESRYDLSIISFIGFPSIKNSRTVTVCLIIYFGYFVYIASVLGK